MTKRHCAGAAALGLLLLSIGCAPAYRRAEIPLGQWSGNGMFVSARESDEDAEGGGTPNLLEHGRYPTRLTIEAAPEGGEGAVRIEILSERQGYESLEGDRTHLIAHLVPMADVGDDAIGLYRLAKLGLSFDEDEPDVEEEAEGPARASCMLVDGEVVLRIHYLDGFVDVFRFRGDRVYKDGVFAPDSEEEEFGFVNWSEVLRRGG